jgi:small subunit ribosomal protein S9
MKQAANTNHGVGRRKSAVARVWLKPGKGAITVNGLEHSTYFDTDMTRDRISTALNVTNHQKSFDIKVNVLGGGRTGQADAIKLGIARALLTVDEKLRPLLKKHGLLTVDARVKERKKPGQKGARAKFQFVKR